MIANKSKTQEILDRYNLRAKKSLGQNFLVDGNIVNKIIQAARIDSDTGVIEIGPGIGSLTEALAKVAKKVLAYEIDERFIRVLEENLGDHSNLLVINKDFLKVDLTDDLDYFIGCKRIVVVSNLPYYITTPIIFKLLEEKSEVNEFYFMVQKEVGVRLTSKVGTKDYNSLSVLMEYRSDAKILFGVSRNSFIPIPNVDSVIIEIRKKELDLGISNNKGFMKFIRLIFSQRRKTLVNNLKGAYSISKEQLQEHLQYFNKSITVRSEELSLEEIASLYLRIFESPSN